MVDYKPLNRKHIVLLALVIMSLAYISWDMDQQAAEREAEFQDTFKIRHDIFYSECTEALIAYENVTHVTGNAWLYEDKGYSQVYHDINVFYDSYDKAVYDYQYLKNYGYNLEYSDTKRYEDLQIQKAEIDSIVENHNFKDYYNTDLERFLAP